MTYLVGRGISDVTGEPAASDRRLLLVVNDLPMITESITQAVLKELATQFGERYREANVLISATHTHCGPGGYSHYLLYNLTTNGFHEVTFRAIVDGIVEAVERADADVAPAELSLAHGELRDASINRSRSSFDRNPLSDKEFFPDAIDPQTTLLRIDRDGRAVGAVNWFPTHGTSMSHDNCLISGDNKGYAGYHWERIAEGVDYRAHAPDDFIGAFAQTNTGDMSPNLNNAPSSGPTDDEFENTRIIGLRQYRAAAALLEGGGTALGDGLDYRLTYVDLGDTEVEAAFTGDGRAHHTSPAQTAAAALAGTDEGKGFPGFRQGRNPIMDRLSDKVIYRFSSRLREAQSPKAIVLPASPLNRLYPMVQERVPVQLFRLGRLYLIGIPGEVTIVAGLRLRRAVAAVVGADLHDVLVAGYANAYFHYVTTPEEYDNQRYEGGSTLFGRWQLGALVQTATRLATAMRDGTPTDPGPRPADLSGRRASWQRKRPADVPVGGPFGEVLVHPATEAEQGGQVTVVFVGAYPNNDLHRGGTYLEVQRADGAEWRTVADDGDWSTKLHYERRGRAGSHITITWDVPDDAAGGEYRIRYHGDARDRSGALHPFIGTSKAFVVGR